MSELDSPDPIDSKWDILAKLSQVSNAVPPEVSAWLALLTLLYGVPFENLVPDSRMLPDRSARFFYMDANWLESLADGAFSIGAHSELDIRFHTAMQHSIREATSIAAGKLRQELRGEKPAPAVTEENVRCGFLMRSSAVSGWPGLEVQATRAESTTPVNLLRMDRLAPDVLLCIFAGIPDRVDIWEPSEDLHFGLSTSINDENRLVVLLRNADTGERLPLRQEVDAPFRDSGRRVLNMRRLSADLSAALGRSSGALLASADFGVQMIDAADKVTFTGPFKP